MDAVEKANAEKQKRWSAGFLHTRMFLRDTIRLNRAKDKKIGEGTYAVVYQGV